MKRWLFPVLLLLLLCACGGGADSGGPADSGGREVRAEDGYAEALTAQRCGDIRIYKHAAIIEGHILPDKPKKRR